MLLGQAVGTIGNLLFSSSGLKCVKRVKVHLEFNLLFKDFLKETNYSFLKVGQQYDLKLKNGTLR